MLNNNLFSVLQQRPDTSTENEIVEFYDQDNIEIGREQLVDIVAQFGQSPSFKIKFIASNSNASNDIIHCENNYNIYQNPDTLLNAVVR